MYFPGYELYGMKSSFNLQDLKRQSVRCSVVGLAAEVRLCKNICQATQGDRAPPLCVLVCVCAGVCVCMQVCVHVCVCMCMSPVGLIQIR